MARSNVTTGRGDVKRDSVIVGQDCKGIRANLVCRITVGGDPIRAGNDGVNFAFTHDLTGHRIADQRRVDSSLAKLPGG